MWSPRKELISRLSPLFSAIGFELWLLLRTSGAIICGGRAKCNRLLDTFIAREERQ
jgi:hypothetical protein